MSDVSRSSSTTSSLSSKNQPEVENPCQLECDPIYEFKGRLRIKFIDVSHAQNFKSVMDLLVKFCLMGIGAITLFLIFAVYFLDDCYPQIMYHSEKVAHGYLCAFAMQFWFPFAYLLVNQFNGTSRGWKNNHLMWTFAIFKFVGTALLCFGVSEIFFDLKKSPAEEYMSDPVKPISSQAKCEKDNMSVITIYKPPMWITFYNLPVSHYLFGLLATTFAILDIMALLLLALPENEKGRNYAVSGMFLLNIPFIICNGLCLLFQNFYLIKTEWNQKFLNFAGLFNIFLVFFILFDILIRKFAPNFLYKKDYKIIKPNKNDITHIGRQILRKDKKTKREYTNKIKKIKEEDQLSRSSLTEKKNDAWDELDAKAIERSAKHIAKAKVQNEKMMKYTTKIQKIKEVDQLSSSSSREKKFAAWDELDAKAIKRSAKHIAKAKAQKEKMIKKVEKDIEKAKITEAKAYEQALRELEKARKRQKKENEKAKQNIIKAKEKARRKLKNAETICGRAVNRAKEQGKKDITEAERAYMKKTGMRPIGLNEQKSSTSS